MLVLVATDGTETALAAAHAATGVLRAGASIIVANVVPPVVEPMAMASGFAGPLVTPAESEQMNQEMLRGGREALAEASHELEAEADDVEVVLVRGGNAGPAIVELAEDRNVDVIVVGESDKGWFQRLVSGSVMHHVVGHAPCPVLVVPGADHHR